MALEVEIRQPAERELAALVGSRIGRILAASDRSRHSEGLVTRDGKGHCRVGPERDAPHPSSYAALPHPGLGASARHAKSQPEYAGVSKEALPGGGRGSAVNHLLGEFRHASHPHVDAM